MAYSPRQGLQNKGEKWVKSLFVIAKKTMIYRTYAKAILMDGLLSSCLR